MFLIASAVPISLPRIEAVLEGRTIQCALRASGRARRPGLWIAPETGLVVTAPQGLDESRVRAFLQQHRRWILRQMERFQRCADAPSRWPYGPALLYRGDPHAVLARRAASGRVDRTPDRRLLVSARSPSIEGVRQMLQRWLKHEASRLLGERVAALGPRMGLVPGRVYVRNLRDRWGSCWPGGSLSFNYRLIMAPPEILDYVVVHELAHLREPNHSPRFWALVAGEYPAHREARRLLRTLGPALSV